MSMTGEDEEGNEVSDHMLGLKVLPLTVAALTACKYLINKLEEKEII